MISHPQFIPRFIAFHRDYYSKPYTIIFHKADVLEFKGMDYYQPFCKILSEESKILHGKEATASSYFDFMPSAMITRASFDDLLLVTPGRRSCRDLYVCNRVTKRYFQLPKPPEDCYKSTRIGFALLCMPGYSNKELGFSTNGQYQYKVVIINMYRPLLKVGEVECPFSVTVFCSKSGDWSRSRFSFPPPTRRDYGTFIDVVTCNGILYWMDVGIIVTGSLHWICSQTGVVQLVFPMTLGVDFATLASKYMWELLGKS